VGKREQRVLTSQRYEELSSKLYEYLTKNWEKHRLYGKDVLMISTRVIYKRLGIHHSQLRLIFKYMQRRKMLKVLGKRKGCSKTIYYVKLLRREREKEVALA